VIPVREHSLDFMKVGQSFTTDGIKISLVATGDNDQIRFELAP
jgi:Tfp pilus assembly PilM family ATPase